MFFEPSSRPVDEHRDSVPTIIFGSFLTAHAGIENSATACCSVVGSEYENSIILNAEINEELTGFSDVIIDIGDHAKESGDAGLLIFVKIEVFLRTVKRAMRSICGNVS